MEVLAAEAAYYYMYESFYSLKANPFRLVPDARFFYASSGHKRGLAYLRYGLHQGQGFVVVTGRPGTGKSTLVQTLFSDLTDKQLVVASLTSTNLGADDILQAVGHSFDVYGDGSNKASLLIAIESFLKAKARQGKSVILIVDEAHNLPLVSLEELRMLSNFQLDDQPLLQIMLLGQDQLPDMLARPDMEQLSQRVIASCHLKPLNKPETCAYISHRLQCVGWTGDPSISAEAVAVVYAASTGIPRLINIFCDRMFLAASLDGSHAIDLQQARAVLSELQHEATGTFRQIKLDLDDLAGFEPLTADNIKIGAASVCVVEESVAENNRNTEKPSQTNEPPASNDAAESPDDFEPNFSSTAKPQSNTVTPQQPLEDTDEVVHPVYPSDEEDSGKFKALQKPLIIVAVLGVVLALAALYVYR